ncbi:MAG: GNAT family N-acetyltransferase [Acidobacteriota bacterium]|nr:GNAT family N-acetyltransferase [Acidobacteriota bacterium]
MSALFMSPTVLPTAAPAPGPVVLTGRYVTVTPLCQEHFHSIWEGTSEPANGWLWTYLFDGPYSDRASFDSAMSAKVNSRDPLFFALIDHRTGLSAGHAAYMRIEPKHRCIEVGSILYSPAFQRTAAATEAMYLMARHVFEDLGYRRYEWKCNALNELSRRAALRLGFTFEGIFRQHMIIKGRNRDTAWFAMLDGEWPARKAAFEHWLAPENFDRAGCQISRLG